MSNFPDKRSHKTVTLLTGIFIYKSTTNSGIKQNDES